MMEYIFLLNAGLSLKLRSLRDRQTLPCRVYLASMTPAHIRNRYPRLGLLSNRLGLAIGKL